MTAATHGAIGYRRGRIKSYSAALIVAFILAQWTAGRRIGASTIFDGQHVQVAHSIMLFQTALETELSGDCSSGVIRKIYFDDLDVALPYIVNAGFWNTRCQPVRPTPVTPLNVDETAQCSSLIVKEQHLSSWLPGVVGAELGPVATRVSILRRWSSPDRKFGFTVYRKRGCSEPVGVPSGD
ncbi:hypothetical protein HNQ77_004260 [Silvibacterium bohemicum]|uniref:Uncharacterized protein n=1 Tax=Silvibacterium bohemicum TaxID=1577686 RepID=A0A841K6S8_9BACT|nr:hypothetical protein [Silvibacterium bohemicum]MBB6146288.1 hypothetical protein [Silvibacterium bohemicum]